MAATVALAVLEDVESILKGLSDLHGRAKRGTESELLAEDEPPAARIRLGSETVGEETTHGEIESRERDVEVRLAARDEAELARVSSAVQAALASPTWRATPGAARDWRLTSVGPGEPDTGARRLWGEVLTYRLTYWTPLGDPTQEA